MVLKRECLVVVVLLVAVWSGAEGKQFIPYDGPPLQVGQPLPLLTGDELPAYWDIRNVSGQNYGSRVMNQQSPSVCGSCWAEAATGALSDRYALFTEGKLRVQLSPQILLNFDARISGGSCNGGNDLKAYEFMHRYGIVDDACQPFVGLNWLHGFEVASKVTREGVRSHQCYKCDWDGTCGFSTKNVIWYGVEEFGSVKGEAEMMSEIAQRGSISCSINSEANAFDQYYGGIISCPRNDTLLTECRNPHTDHVIVIAGYGVDEETGMKYWVGRNSYGTDWGEGAGGGWFRLERGVNALNIEKYPCNYAVPSQESIALALKQYDMSLAK